LARAELGVRDVNLDSKYAHIGHNTTILGVPGLKMHRVRGMVSLVAEFRIAMPFSLA
jgi:hypothetical protein